MKTMLATSDEMRGDDVIFMIFTVLIERSLLRFASINKPIQGMQVGKFYVEAFFRFK